MTLIWYHQMQPYDFEKMFTYEHRYRENFHPLHQSFRLNMEWLLEINFTVDTPADGRNYLQVGLFGDSHLVVNQVDEDINLENAIRDLRSVCLNQLGSIPDRLEQFFMECFQYFSQRPVHKRKK